jgi:hypothetical protein
MGGTWIITQEDRCQIALRQGFDKLDHQPSDRTKKTQIRRLRERAKRFGELYNGIERRARKTPLRVSYSEFADFICLGRRSLLFEVNKRVAEAGTSSCYPTGCM